MIAEGAFFSNGGPSHPNEDAVLPVQKLGRYWVSAIADGVGSYAGAAIASKTAIETIAAMTNENVINVNAVYLEAKRRLEQAAASQKAFAKMATTLSAVWINQREAVVGHVGDTRVYHLRGNGLLDRTRDQTEGERLIEEGVLTRARAKKYGRRNVLLSALSPGSDFELVETAFEVRPGDRLVLLSDGVHSVVPRRVVRDLATSHDTPGYFCDALAREVLARGPKDDFSAVCINLR